MHEENKGGAAARNTGVRMSAGELITFLDDDDTYYKEKLEKQVEHIIAEQLDVSLCAADIVFTIRPQVVTTATRTPPALGISYCLVPRLHQ